MGRLALVVGSKSVSSKPIRAAEPVEDFDGDDPSHQTILRPIDPALTKTPANEDEEETYRNIGGAVATSISQDQTWQAIVSVHVYPRIKVVTEDTTVKTKKKKKAEANESSHDAETPLDIHSRVAEVRIQILPATEALSLLFYRDAHHRIDLPPPPLPDNDDNGDDRYHNNIQIVFSRDKRFLLMLLVEHGDLILFQLRKPRAESGKNGRQHQELTKPSYLAHEAGAAATSNDAAAPITLPVATQPKYVNSPTPVTAISQGPDEHTFWIGTAKGTVHVLCGRPCLLSDPLPSTIDVPRILQIDWVSRKDKSKEGLLCILDVHEEVHVVETKCVHATKENGEDTKNNSVMVSPKKKTRAAYCVKLKNKWIKLPCTTAVHAVTWLPGQNQPHLVTLTQAPATVTLTVWTVPLLNLQDWKSIITNMIRRDGLEGLESCSIKIWQASKPSLHYDIGSDSLVVKACFESDGESFLVHPFCSIWSWRTNVQGWKQPIKTPFASLHVARHVEKQYPKLILTSWEQKKIRKERYDMAVLSPSNKRLFERNAATFRPNPLVLAESSVWYPQCTKQSGQEQMEWMEGRLPTEYLALYGSPTLAAWGGEEIAVAATRGVLVCRKGGRWHQFANSSAEGKCLVLAMMWWTDLDSCDDSVLLAVLRMQGESGWTSYLSCWSSRLLDFDKQLLIPVPSYDNEGACGMNLPYDMGEDLCLDIISQGDRAVALISSATTDSLYRVYQLQIVPATKTTEKAGSYQEHRPYSVLATCIATGAVESCSKLWLASSSFGFDLVALRSGKLDLRLLDYVATLGVWRTANGLVDALAISPDTVVAVGEVCKEESAVVVDVWCADRERSFVAWTLQLSNGKLLTWKLPIATKPEDHVAMAEPIIVVQDPNTRPRWVNEKSRLVGKVCYTESNSAWMQGSGRMTSTELCLGLMPGGRFGYAIAAGQSCRQMHRMLGEDFESEIFLSDFLQNEVFGPGDLVLLPPLFVSPLYMSILEDPGSIERYLCLPITKERDRNAILLAIRLLIFAAVDRLATNKASSLVSKEARKVFHCAVRLARDLLGKESLRFVAFIIELARQLEPSRFEYFLPLPPPENETIGRLLEIASMNGSISLSLAALPLLTNKSKARTICASTFRLCLSACMKPHSVHIPVRREASESLSDLFRFGLKLEETDQEIDDDGFLDRSLDADIIDDDSSDEEGVEKHKQYSMFCGITRLFGGKTNVDGHRVASHDDNIMDHGYKSNGRSRALELKSSSLPAEGVTDVVAHMFHTLLLDASHLMLWGSAARMASLLLPESLAGLHTSSKQDLTVILRETSARPIRHVLPKEFRRKDGLVDFFSASISRCMDCLEDYETSRVVDLLLVILKRKSTATDRQMEHQTTLLLVLLVVGHVSGRLDDLVSVDADHLIMQSLQKAIKGPEPKQRPPPQPSRSDDEASQLTEDLS